MDRKPLEEVLGMIDSASVDSFYDFLNFMLSNEYGFLLDNPENFPQISNKVHDDHVILKDCIIEIDPTEFEKQQLSKILGKTVEELFPAHAQLVLDLDFDIDSLPTEEATNEKRA